jgi:hypothetical protein
MQRGQQRLFDANLAVEQIEQRDDGVGRAGGGRDQLFGAGQRFWLMPATMVASTSSPLAPGCESSRRGQPASMNLARFSR